MKRRTKFTVADPDLPKQKKNSNNPLLQSNLSFLTKYNNLFRKPGSYSGDAESYFKHSLRNSNEFDLVGELGRNRLIDTSRSVEDFLTRLKKQNIKKLATEVNLVELLKDEDPDNFSTKSEKEPEEELQLISEVEPILEVEEMAEEYDYLPELDAEYEEAAYQVPENTQDEDDEEGEMKDVEKMLEAASNELDQVTMENKEILEDLDQAEKEDEKAKSAGGDGSVFKFDPKIDAEVIRELEDAEQQAKKTAKTIYELKNRVAELLKKDKMTETEANELEEKNKELKAQMVLFEEKTKRIQFLIGQGNLFENMISPKPMLQRKYHEDVLPKVIVCGGMENTIPKIIVCEGRSKKECKPKCPNSPAPSPVPEAVIPEIAKKLNESYCMQEKLAAENADLEGMRYKLQSDLLCSDQTVESLQKQLCNLQNQMRMVCQENTFLNNQLQTPPCEQPVPSPKRKMSCGKKTCPAEVEARLEEYSATTQQLEKQLACMEREVQEMHGELVAVQKEREHLEHHRKMLCVPKPMPCPPPHVCAPSPRKPPCDQQVREIKEQYNRLQDDFKGKLTEVACLRTDNEKLKKLTAEAEAARKLAEDKLKELEKSMKGSKVPGHKGPTEEQMLEMEQQLNVAKQRFREAQDELEELRALIQDQQTQLDDYRNKYLEAQQTVEEQRRQIDMMEMENTRISEQVNLEIQRVKNQFQEKLQELTPLPEILKATQLKLQEAQQMHLLAERNNEAIARELQMYKDKVEAISNQMNEVRSDQQLGEDEKMGLSAQLEECHKKCEELEEEMKNVQVAMEQLEEVSNENERKAQQRLHEVTQLNAQLDDVREESARQVARTKDRCETVRRSMQNQINDLERQLAQTRATAKSAQKDRDEIRQKMQAQIHNLSENFEDAQMRIRNLQGHVNFLKNSANSLFPTELAPAGPPPDVEEKPCTCGTDY